MDTAILCPDASPLTLTILPRSTFVEPEPRNWRGESHLPIAGFLGWPLAMFSRIAVADRLTLPSKWHLNTSAPQATGPFLPFYRLSDPFSTCE